jgi:hypothetical protein
VNVRSRAFFDVFSNQKSARMPGELRNAMSQLIVMGKIFLDI